MSLSNILSLRSLFGIALLLPLLSATPVAAQDIYHGFRFARGFQITQLQQMLYQHAEENAWRLAPPDAIEVIVTEPRYVSVTGPDGSVRSFLLEGPIYVVPVRRNVVHFGANQSTALALAAPARNFHFGANDSDAPLVLVPSQQKIYFGANQTDAPLVYVPQRQSLHFGANH